MFKKLAVANLGTEELDRFKATSLNRAQSRAQADLLFENGKKYRESDRAYTKKLFVQAEGAESSPHSPFQKESAAKNVTEFFEKRAYLTVAQRRYPELLKASADTRPLPDMKKKPAPDAPSGPTPAPNTTLRNG